MVHALWSENKVQHREHNFLHPQLLQDRVDHMDAEVERIKSGQSRLLRSYAGTNQPVFFAVAVEHFFEQPKAFKRGPPLHRTVSVG